MKTYDEYMPQKKTEKVLTQGKVAADLHQKIAKILKEEDWTWEEFLTGLFTKYLDDRSSKKRTG